MFDIEFLGHFPGFDFGSTPGLVEQYLLRTSHGFARTTSPRLFLPADPVSEADLVLHSLQGRMDMLDGFVGGSSPIKSLGVADSQLDDPDGFIRSMFVANMQAGNLHKSSVAPGELFVNPGVSYVEAFGTQEDADGCLSFSGLVLLARRWRVIDIWGLGRTVSREVDTVAFILQHEWDHLFGIPCMQRRVPGTPIFFVPPEVRTLFFEQFFYTGRMMEWPYQLPGDSWLEAMAFLDMFCEPYRQN